MVVIVVNCAMMAIGVEPPNSE